MSAIRINELQDLHFRDALKKIPHRTCICAKLDPCKVAEHDRLLLDGSCSKQKSHHEGSLMEMTAKTKIDRHTFFAALMLSLCAKGREEFDAEGDVFHSAFLRTVERVQKDQTVELKRAGWIRMDPMFGVVPEANEMLLEAEHDRLLGFLNPYLRKARFRINKEQAAKELRELVPTNADWFIDLGDFFNTQLASAE